MHHCRCRPTHYSPCPHIAFARTWLTRMYDGVRWSTACPEHSPRVGLDNGTLCDLISDHQNSCFRPTSYMHELGTAFSRRNSRSSVRVRGVICVPTSPHAHFNLVATIACAVRFQTKFFFAHLTWACFSPMRVGRHEGMRLDAKTNTPCVMLHRQDGLDRGV